MKDLYSAPTIRQVILTMASRREQVFRTLGAGAKCSYARDFVRRHRPWKDTPHHRQPREYWILRLVDMTKLAQVRGIAIEVGADSGLISTNCQFGFQALTKWYQKN